MSTYSYMNRPNYSNRGGATYGNVALASEGQKSTIMKLCEQKRVRPKDYSAMSREEAGKYIEELIALAPPISEAQRNIIKGLCEECVSAGLPNARMLSDEELNKYTGGREGTASKLIENLQKYKRKHYELFPPDTRQLDRLVRMQLCPAVPFNVYGVQTQIPITEKAVRYNYDRNSDDPFMSHTDKEVVVGMRLLTEAEFRHELTTKLKHNEASKLIDQYEMEFMEWERERLSQWQITQIRKQEARMASLYAPPMIAQNEEGDFEEVFNLESRKTEYAPTAFKALSDAEIWMFSSEQADQYIRQLRYELNAINGESAKPDMEEDVTFESIRSASDAQKWKTQEFTKLNNLMYSLQAIGGIENPELHDEVCNVFFSIQIPNEGETGDLLAGSSPKEIKRVKKLILNFMKSLLDNDCITMNSLVRICQNSEVASDLLAHLLIKPRYARMMIQELK